MDEFQPYELEIIEAAESLRLLAPRTVGRMVFTIRARPVVEPVNFTLHEGAIVIRVGRGSKLATAVRNAIVAFEVDDLDEQTRTGWSVTVVGRADVVVDPAAVARLGVEGPRPWPSGVRDYLIRIFPETVTGRRLRPTPAAAA